MSIEPPTQEQLAIAAAEQERSDMLDIRALRKDIAFTRYWLRRLKQKKDEAERSFKYDALDAEKREIRRQLFLAYEELEQMMDRQEGAVRAALERQ